MDAILEALEKQSKELETIKQRLPEPFKIPRPLELAMDIGLPGLAIVLAGYPLKAGHLVTSMG
jgi:hypothetical protein